MYSFPRKESRSLVVGQRSNDDMSNLFRYGVEGKVITCFNFMFRKYLTAIGVYFDNPRFEPKLQASVNHCGEKLSYYFNDYEEFLRGKLDIFLKSLYIMYTNDAIVGIAPTYTFEGQEKTFEHFSQPFPKNCTAHLIDLSEESKQNSSFDSLTNSNNENYSKW